MGKVVQETRRDHQILYFCLYYYHWVDTSAGGLLFPEVIIRYVGSALAMRWFIRYVFTEIYSS